MKAGWRLRRFSRGSMIVARRVRRGFVPLDADGEVRLIATVLRCGPALYAAPRLLDLAHQSPLWLAGGTGAWCIAAWRARPEQPASKADNVNLDPVGEEPEEDLDGPDEAAEMLADLHRMMPGPDDRLHLAQIASRLLGDEAATGRVRELCAEAGIPITAVRVKGRGSSTGIYARDLPPLPCPSSPPLPSVVAAGQARQQQHQQRIETGGGEGFITLPDPDGPANRTVVHWTTTSR